LITELMGSSLRSREAIALGENDSRRFSDIIESAQSVGWHSFEQSLVKAFEEDLITEETAMLYCTNKPQMHQRLDSAKKRQETSRGTGGLKMRIEEPPLKPKFVPRPPPPPILPPTMPGGSTS
jgi:twitching motility protein PilT